jgi:peptidoglycan/xylan/chitin deacetylase (PgdA/CDA1 family)
VPSDTAARAETHVRGLERLLQPLESVALDATPGTEPASWLNAGDWRMFASPRSHMDAALFSSVEIERFQLENGLSLGAYQRPDGRVYVPFDLEEAYSNYVTEACSHGGDVRKLSEGQLKLYYRLKGLLPREFWLTLRRLFIRLGHPPSFPSWPFDRSVDRLLRFYALCLLLELDQTEAFFSWFWPGTHQAALVLSHDVESAAGLRLALELADLEEERGFRSSFNIVGAQYEIDMRIVHELQGRGFEIGLHGLQHDRSLFSSRAEFERQLPGLAQAAKALGAQGFRSPATHRVLDWLEELPVDYDCTVPHSDPYEPQPGGCCSLWPFMLGRIVELPYTMPQDHTLFTLLRRRSVSPWLEQAKAIEQRFGLIQVLSHPDRGYLGDTDKREFYVELLDALSEREQLWKALPREVASWWRQRENGETRTAAEQLTGTIRRPDEPGDDYVLIEPPSETAPAPSLRRQADVSVPVLAQPQTADEN